MGTEARIDKGHRDFTPDHRTLTVIWMNALGFSKSVEELAELDNTKSGLVDCFAILSEIAKCQFYY